MPIAMASLRRIACLLLPLAVQLVTAASLPENIGDDFEDLDKRQDNFITQYWGNDFANFEYESGPAAGEYALEWDQRTGGNFVVGKGYRPGGDRVVSYKGEFDVNRRAYLALYGWTTNPLVEWYVIEDMGIHNPSDNSNATCYGTIETDNGTYEIWMKWRINAPSIIGDADFQQFWSIRTRRHVGGSINTTEHFQAYAKAGLKLGRHNYMALAVEGQDGAGAAHITVGVAPTTRVSESATPTTRTERPQATNTCRGRLDT